MIPKLTQKDLDLLEFAALAQWVTHRQLFEFSIIRNIEPERKMFEWRVGRFAEGGQLRKQRPAFLDRKILYSITRTGIVSLELHGVHLLSLFAEPKGDGVDHQIAHSLELNRIHLALIKSKSLISWEPSHAIRVLHQFDKSSYAKIYDAVATLVIGNEVYTVGVEYERSLKPTKKYMEILTRLSTRDGVDVVVYLCPSLRILGSMRLVFGNFLKKPVLIAEHQRFVEDPLNASVEWRDVTTTIRRVLEQIRQRGATSDTAVTDAFHR